MEVVRSKRVKTQPSDDEAAQNLLAYLDAAVGRTPLRAESHFESLPAEIKMIIYRLAIVGPSQPVEYWKPHERNGLLLVNKEMNEDGKKAFLQVTNFAFHLLRDLRDFSNCSTIRLHRSHVRHMCLPNPRSDTMKLSKLTFDKLKGFSGLQTLEFDASRVGDAHSIVEHAPKSCLSIRNLSGRQLLDSLFQLFPKITINVIRACKKRDGPYCEYPWTRFYLVWPREETQQKIVFDWVTTTRVWQIVRINNDYSLLFKSKEIRRTQASCRLVRVGQYQSVRYVQAKERWDDTSSDVDEDE